LAVFIVGCGSAKLHGGVITPPWAAADINMPDQNGNLFQLSAARGKVVLVFFGFTNCVEECPLTMAHLKLAVEALDKNAKDVQVVMISTDPVRDTPQAMQDFVEKFNPAFIGITGTQTDLKKIWDGYSVLVEDGGETHSNFTYVIDKTGNIRETVSPDTAPEDIAADLKALLAEK
jgi:protein SCO1/2